jgi:phage baseplate assembly protein W
VPQTVNQGFAPSKFLNFLGKGVTTPFRRGSSDFASASGVGHIQSMIGQVLGTRASTEYTVGELPWRPEFGSWLHLLRHKNNTDVLADLGRVYVAQALARWVPQVQLLETAVTRELGPPTGDFETVLLLRLRYDIIGINRPGNSVLVPDVTQVLTV